MTDNRAAIGAATSAIRDLQALLIAERCMAQVTVDVGDSLLRWAQWGPRRVWTILMEYDGASRPLLELPALARLEAMPHLDRLASEAREKMSAAVRRAGLDGAGDAR